MTKSLKMKKLLLLLITSLFAISLFGQSKNFNIKGIVTDTLDNPLVYATVLLLQQEDSTMVSFTRTELDGSFIIKDIAPGSYVVKATYVGFLPLAVDVAYTGKNINLGKIKMKEISEKLMAVVIKAAKAQIKIRGDTIEYDASTFKVPPGSSVEELLRQLPGIEVEEDGSIQSDGKSVTKVTVDGKSFFGSDPKAATKNLPAEGISKVQVFDRKSEQEKVTGIKTESQEKTMNLELKEGYKKGGFGRVIAGIGTKNRKELKGNYNKFDKKNQFSLVGVGNNTGRNGLGWNDYQDFMGSNSFSFGSNLTYGFDVGRTHFIFGGEDNDLESTIQNSFFSGGRTGFPENYNGGASYNYNHKKTKISSVYFFNHSGLIKNKISESTQFQPQFVLNSDEIRRNDDAANTHRIESTFQKELDSLHTIIFKLNGGYIDENKNSNGEISLHKDDLLSRKTDFSNSWNNTGNLLDGAFIFRKKFKKKRRRMGFNISYLRTKLNKNGAQSDILTWLDNTGAVDSTYHFNQVTKDTTSKHLFRVNALYSEPISKKITWISFYNYSNRKDDGYRIVGSQAWEIFLIDPDLSRDSHNKITKHRFGTGLTYAHNGVNITLGGAYQKYGLSGNYLSKKHNAMPSVVSKDYTYLVPHASISFSPRRNGYFTASYTINIEEPSIQQLQPVVDNRNPLYIYEGNQELSPEVSHAFSLYYNGSNPLAGIRYSLSVDYNTYITSIINRQTIGDDLVTYTTPVNFEGGKHLSYWASLNFPIIKKKVKLKLYYNGFFDNEYSIINDVTNKAKTIWHRPRLRLTITPWDDFRLSINSSLSLSNTKYDISTGQNQKERRSTIGASLNTKLFGGLFLDTDFNMSNYSNERFGLDQNIPIWNASISRHFLAENKLEARISIYDIFDQSIRINQSSSSRGFFQSKTETLGRYLMATLTYNIRGMKAGVKKNRWF